LDHNPSDFAQPCLEGFWGNDGAKGEVHDGLSWSSVAVESVGRQFAVDAQGQCDKFISI